MGIDEDLQWLGGVKSLLQYKKLIHYKEEIEAIQRGIEALNRLANLRRLYVDETTYPRPTIRHAIARLPSEIDK